MSPDHRPVFLPAPLALVPPAGQADRGLAAGRPPTGRRRKVSALVRVAQPPVAVVPVVILRVDQRVRDQSGAAEFARRKERQQRHRVVIGESGVAQHDIEFVVGTDRFIAQQQPRFGRARQIVMDVVEIEHDIAVPVDRGFRLPREPEQDVGEVQSLEFHCVGFPVFGKFDVTGGSLRRGVGIRLVGIVRAAAFAARAEDEALGAGETMARVGHVAPVQPRGAVRAGQRAVEEEPAAPVGAVRAEFAADAGEAGVGILAPVLLHRRDGILVARIAHLPALGEMIPGGKVIVVHVELLVELVHDVGEVVHAARPAGGGGIEHVRGARGRREKKDGGSCDKGLCVAVHFSCSLLMFLQSRTCSMHPLSGQNEQRLDAT
ncbi:MAG: hypothetical protein BWY59_01098 [Verrucomicrobia bacterium ADurb.Bin345]|nr:MAG: hypothetical protein BWY59_01098 [Verrucomicrobia bacterium ADurb.Bin345]